MFDWLPHFPATPSSGSRAARAPTATEDENTMNRRGARRGRGGTLHGPRAGVKVDDMLGSSAVLRPGARGAASAAALLVLSGSSFLVGATASSSSSSSSSTRIKGRMKEPAGAASGARSPQDLNDPGAAGENDVEQERATAASRRGLGDGEQGAAADHSLRLGRGDSAAAPTEGQVDPTHYTAAPRQRQGGPQDQERRHEQQDEATNKAEADRYLAAGDAVDEKNENLQAPPERAPFHVRHNIELNAVKIAKARSHPMRQLCPRGDKKEMCRQSNKNLDALDRSRAQAGGGISAAIEASGAFGASGELQGSAPAAAQQDGLAAAGGIDQQSSDAGPSKMRGLAGHAAGATSSSTPKGPPLGHRIYARIKAGTLQLAPPDAVNTTTVRNMTFLLPVQPPSVRIYKKQTIPGSNLGDHADPVPIHFEDLDQECKNAVTNFVIYEGITFATDQCRNHCQLRPFRVDFPAACQEDVCDLWTKMLTKEATGQAPCRKYICYIAPYLMGYTAADSRMHCGARFLRDAYFFCDWTGRGGSMWAGRNTRVPQQLFYPRRSHFSSYPVRKRWADLTIGEKAQMGYLGWKEASGVVGAWPERRFATIFIGDIMNDVYLPNVTMTVKKGWYGSWCPESEFKCYDELSEVQKDAVRKLHYTIDGWHLNSDVPGVRDHCNWPASLASQNVYRADGDHYHCMSWRSYLERPLHLQWGGNPWDTLTEQKKEAYTSLGYNTPQSWDQRQIPDTMVSKWDKLTTSERGAAAFLMFTEDTWNGCPEEECIFRLLYAESLLIPTRSTEFRALDWNMFADFQKVHLEQLGWQSDSWNDGGPIPATFFLDSWVELTPAIQTIARKYGHTEDTWSRCPGTPCLKKYEYIQRKYSGPWALLSPRVQRTFVKLGWTQQMWDEKQAGVSQEVPDTYRKLWKDLTQDERIDAQFFDYDEFSWNGCAGADEDTTTTAAPPSTQDPFRRIRARLYMPRSYNEIMSVNPTTMETTTPPPAVVVTTSSATTTAAPDSTGGFVLVAQQAIARSLFCNNPDYNANRNPDQRDPNGMPLCMDKDPYERQMDRINVLNVGQGILMDFEILANRTAKEVSAVHLYERLLTATNNPQSDFRHDADFQRFSSVGQLSMLTFSEAEYAQEQANLQFEVLRAQFDEEKACELFSDKKNGINKCPEDSAVGMGVGVALAVPVLLHGLLMWGLL